MDHLVLEHVIMLMIQLCVILHIGKVVSVPQEYSIIDLEQRRCVEPSQCTSRSEPPVVQRTSEDGQYGCTPRFVCPFNEVEDNSEASNYSPCQYTVEVTRVFKGTLEVLYVSYAV